MSWLRSASYAVVQWSLAAVVDFFLSCKLSIFSLILHFMFLGAQVGRIHFLPGVELKSSPGLQKHGVLVKGMLAAVTNKSPLFSDLTQSLLPTQ